MRWAIRANDSARSISAVGSRSNGESFSFALCSLRCEPFISRSTAPNPRSFSRVEPLRRRLGSTWTVGSQIDGPRLPLPRGRARAGRFAWAARCKIIAPRSATSFIVFGFPESFIYQLEKGINFGNSYLFHFKSFLVDSSCINSVML